MPNENATVSTNAVGNRSKSMAFLISAIIVGVVLVIVFNGERMPFGRSLNMHPPQLLGLIIIVAAIFGLVILCVRCLVMSSNQTPLTSTSTISYTFRTSNQQSEAVPAGITQLTILNAEFYPHNQSHSELPSEQTHTQQQSAIPQTPPPEFELPPSYAEATKGLQVTK